jgi:leader peptidase (prepilin peptidase)/N-methyltransferase
VSFFIVIFFSDLRYGTVPENAVLAGSFFQALYLILFQKDMFFPNLATGIGASLFFISVSLIFYALTKKQSIGGGDITLAFFLGFFLGFPGTLVALYIAFLTGALFSIILVLWKRKSFRTGTVPFGPFMISGTFLTLFLGDRIWNMALKTLGL